jgi:hypothetical protein
MKLFKFVVDLLGSSSPSDTREPFTPIPPDDLALVTGGSSDRVDASQRTPYPGGLTFPPDKQIGGLRLIEDHRILNPGLPDGTPSGNGAVYDQEYFDFARPQTQAAYDNMNRAAEALEQLPPDTAVKILDGNIGTAIKEGLNTLNAYDDAQANYVRVAAQENDAGSYQAFISQQMANGRDIEMLDSNMSNNDGSPGYANMSNLDASPGYVRADPVSDGGYSRGDASYSEPNASYYEPSYSEPNASYYEPSYSEPNASYSEPSYSEPNASYSEPNASYSEPSYSEPNASYEPSSSEPNASYPEPNASYDPGYSSYDY